MTDANQPTHRLDRVMEGAAVFRITLGALSWVAPRAVARVYGLKAVDAKFVYMTRVFGVRAVALGAGYLASSGESRELWHRLCLLCDGADTAMGAAMVASGSLRGPFALGALATSTPATALDVASMVARRRRSG